jgi:hypothetical protein
MADLNQGFKPEVRKDFSEEAAYSHAKKCVVFLQFATLALLDELD